MDERVRRKHLDELAAELRRRLVERRRAQAASGGAALGPLPEAVRDLVDEDVAILEAPTRERLCELILREAVGLGPLEELLADPAVEEVMVNGHDRVYVERAGRIERTEVSFPSEQSLRDAIERILTPLGRRVDELSPMVDARLEDGSRVHVVIPPLSVDGPSVSIRRFSAVRPGPRELVELGTITEELHDELAAAVGARRSILVSGGTGSGKTTLLNALSAFIDSDERVITIEDAAELSLRQRHVVRLESRPANVEGRGRVTIRDLLRGALRMRPDRILIGEVRGGEALDLLMALNTGHEGALSTVHANSPEDALRRIETLALMAGVGLPHEAIREQLGRGLDLVIHLARLSDGSRRVVEVAEVVGRRLSRGAGALQAGKRDRGTRVGGEALIARWRGARGGCSPRGSDLRATAGQLAPRVHRPAAPGLTGGLCAQRRRAAAPRTARQRAIAATALLIAGPGPLAVAGAAGPWCVGAPPADVSATGAPWSGPSPTSRLRSLMRSPEDIRSEVAAAGSLEGPSSAELARRAADLERCAPGCVRTGSTHSPPHC